MKAGFFVMKIDGKYEVSPEYEMMEEFFMRTKIDFDKKIWNVNFWDFQTKEEAQSFVRQQDRPMSVFEHCRRESGLTGLALRNYVNRHYGHN